MKKTEEYHIDMGISASSPSTLDLRGRQSVRATFRLSEACIDAISILSAQLGIKQKSIFDHLLENAQILKSMASELENTEFDRHESPKNLCHQSQVTILFGYDLQQA